MYGTTNQNVWVLQIKCIIITNQNVWALQMKCMVTTNRNVWSIQMKCVVITSQMYSYYKSSYIQFLTLGGLHDRLYKPSKFPFLAGHMTCLPKQPTSLQISLFHRSHDLIMSSIKFPFLVISWKMHLKSA